MYPNNLIVDFFKNMNIVKRVKIQPIESLVIFLRALQISHHSLIHYSCLPGSTEGSVETSTVAGKGSSPGTPGTELASTVTPAGQTGAL